MQHGCYCQSVHNHAWVVGMNSISLDCYVPFPFQPNELFNSGQNGMVHFLLAVIECESLTRLRTINKLLELTILVGNGIWAFIWSVCVVAVYSLVILGMRKSNKFFILPALIVSIINAIIGITLAIIAIVGFSAGMLVIRNDKTHDLNFVFFQGHLHPHQHCSQGLLPHWSQNSL